VNRLAKLAGLGLAAVLLQALAQAIFPAWLRPDLVLVFALAVGMRGGTGGLLLAFGSGFVVDALSGSPPGLFALLRGTACAVTRAADHALYLRAALPWALYVLGYCVFDAVALGLCHRFFLDGGSPPWTLILTRLPGTALFTALVAGFLLPVFLRVDAEAGREQGLALAGRGSQAGS
jgi:cell shape-determining protein MreD